MKRENLDRDIDQDLAQVMTGHGPCSYLLVALIGLILIFPFTHTDIISRIGLATLSSLVLVGGVYAVGRRRRMLVVGLGLAILAIALQWSALLSRDPVLFGFAGIAYIAFLGLTIGEVLRYLLKRGPVTADKLHGALAGYIMIAFLWAFLYAIVEVFAPGSFSFPHSDTTDPHAFFRLLYFSFTTITTVGFGDITPVSDQARSLVMIEEFVGVFFVGILIARLAGLYPPKSE
jgi:hypothetical protein